jgi:hypothetical protein
MAMRDALRFLQWARQDTAILERLRQTPLTDLPQALVWMGREAGDVFTLAELQAAFARDCTMRWLRYRQHADDSDDAAEHGTYSREPP